MAKKNKKKQPIVPKKNERLKQARIWLNSYKGENVVKAYRAKFRVDVTCAIRELQGLGHKFEDGYAERALEAEQRRIEQRQIDKAKKEANGNEDYYNDFQDDRFFFIAGHTSGGAPYGVTWEEMGLEPFDEYP